MRDFTFNAYKHYITLIKKSNLDFLTFREYMIAEKKPDKFCLIRHDVDRKPQNALRMAIIESELGVKATYYFRYKPHVFKKDILKQIYTLGHEIGYHYENLSDTNGNVEKALIDFENNLQEFRKLGIDIKTISMHGRPFNKHDNRDLWRDKNNYKLLKEKYGILGEVYLEIDYTEIAYINDTGRNWTNSRYNVRDKVFSNISADFRNNTELIQHLEKGAFDKICFQIHPERWEDDMLSWTIQLLKDIAINNTKRIINLIR